MSQNHFKKGFTILEILVALTILVVVFSLITLLYVRAARTRNIINAYNEVAEILSQMMDTIVNGRKNFMGQDIPGLKIVSQLDKTEPKEISFTVNKNTPDEKTFTYKITDENTDKTTLKLLTPSGEYDFDPNKKVELQSDSKFEYYTPKFDYYTSGETYTLVKIILSGKSTNPAMKKMTPLRIETSIRLKNKLSF